MAILKRIGGLHDIVCPLALSVDRPATEAEDAAALRLGDSRSMS